MAESETVYGLDRAKFKGFGKYKLDIENRVNDILELTKKEYPNVDNYLLWQQISCLENMEFTYNLSTTLLFLEALNDLG